MFTTQLIILIAVFVIFIVLDSWKPLLAEVSLFLLFLWAMVTFDLSTIQLVFYPIALLFALFIKYQTGITTNSTSIDLDPTQPGNKLKGFVFHTFTIGLGIVMIFFMSLITTSKGQFIGAPTLSIAGDFQQSITLAFAPAISGALGIIENRLIIAVFKTFTQFKDLLPILIDATNAILTTLVGWIPVFGQVVIALSSVSVALLNAFLFALPLAIACLVFGVFHLIAYNILWNLVFMASFIMLMWLVSYIFTKDDTAMNTAHFGWNGMQTMKDSVSFAIAKTSSVIGG